MIQTPFTPPIDRDIVSVYIDGDGESQGTIEVSYTRDGRHVFVTDWDILGTVTAERIDDVRTDIECHFIDKGFKTVSI